MPALTHPDKDPPCSLQHYETYDTIIGSGTIKHIFNTSQGLKNVTRFCAAAAIIHSLPANNFCNHGFRQFLPELFCSSYSEQMVIRKSRYFSPPGVFCWLNVSVYPAINKTMFSILHDAGEHGRSTVEWITGFVRPELAANVTTSGRLKFRGLVWQYGDCWNIFTGTSTHKSAWGNTAPARPLRTSKPEMRHEQ